MQTEMSEGMLAEMLMVAVSGQEIQHNPGFLLHTCLHQQVYMQKTTIEQKGQK